MPKIRINVVYFLLPHDVSFYLEVSTHFEAILVQRLFCVFLASISDVSCKEIIGARIDQVHNKEESMLSAGSADRQTP